MAETAKKIRRLKDRKAELLRLLAAGLTRRAVALRMGVQRSRVGKWVARLGLSGPPGRPKNPSPCPDCGRRPARRDGACCVVGYRNPVEGDLPASNGHEWHQERLVIYEARAAAGLPLCPGGGDDVAPIRKGKRRA